jgi:hypothetical protein
MAIASDLEARSRVCKSNNPKVLIDAEFLEMLRTCGGEVDLGEFDRSGPVAMAEWAIPAGIALFLTRKFFDALMSELGKTAAGALTAAIRKHFGRTKQANERLVNKSDLESFSSYSNTETSQEKLDEAFEKLGRQLAPLEICLGYVTERGVRVRIRFVFTAALSENEFDLALKTLVSTHTQLIALALDGNEDSTSKVPSLMQTSCSFIYDVVGGEWVDAISLSRARR